MTLSTDFRWQDHPAHLNLGCGYDHREGYLNVDFLERHQPDLLADVRELSMLPPEHYESILAIDVLEHLPRSDTDRCLAEWHRLLAPGGRLQLQVPDVRACGRQLLDTDSAGDHERIIHQLWGTQAYSGDFHLAGFTDVLLIDVLAQAGFRVVDLWAKDGWMLVAEAERAGPDPAPPVALGWVAGFYDEEGEAPHSWRWGSDDGELLLVNPAAATLDVNLSFTVTPPTRAQLAVRWPGGEDRLKGGKPRPWSKRLRLEPGPFRLRFSSTGGQPVDAPGDPRRLVFTIAGTRVEVIDESPSRGT